MTKTEKNIFAMYNAVESVFNNNMTEIDKIPAMKDAQTRFSNLFQELRDKDAEYQSMTGGKTEKKNLAEDAMIEALMPVVAAMMAYATLNKDVELKAVVDVTVSDLKRMRDMDLITKADFIYEKASGLGEALVNFGISAELITELRGIIDNYKGYLESKENSFANRGSARDALSELFDETHLVLKEELDYLIEIYKVSNIDFYNSYQNARVIRDVGIHHEPEPTEGE